MIYDMTYNMIYMIYDKIWYDTIYDILWYDILWYDV